MRRLLCLPAALVAAAVLAPAALAHAVLLRTTPADGAVLARSPAEVRLSFDDPVRVASGNAVIRNGGGSVLRGAPSVAAGGKVLVLPLDTSLRNGDYSVRWRIVSDDGHRESGVLAFAVGTGRAPPVPELRAGAGPSAASLAGRWLFFSGLLLAVGTAVFSLWVLRGRLPRPLLLLLAGSLALTVAGAAWLAAGRPGRDALRACLSRRRRACRRRARAHAGRARGPAAAQAHALSAARARARAHARRARARLGPAAPAFGARRRAPRRSGRRLDRRPRRARPDAPARALGGGRGPLLGARGRGRGRTRGQRARPGAVRALGRLAALEHGLRACARREERAARNGARAGSREPEAAPAARRPARPGPQRARRAAPARRRRRGGRGADLHRPGQGRDRGPSASSPGGPGREGSSPARGAVVLAQEDGSRAVALQRAAGP